LMLSTLLGVVAAVTRAVVSDICSVLYVSYRRLVPPDGS
jgi:hypothetical protein